MPGEAYGRRWRRVQRMQREVTGQEDLRWTGTDAQRELTTTDVAAFVARPDRWVWFHDRLRGQVFVRPVPTADDPNPAPLPHRYMQALYRKMGDRLEPVKPKRRTLRELLARA